MTQPSFNLNDNLQQFFSYNEGIWQKIQEFYYGENPISAALAQINAEDIAQFAEAVAQNPIRLMELQMKWWQGQMEIYKNVMLRATTDDDIAPVIDDLPGDRRFKNELWKNQPQFDLLRQSYLHFSITLESMIDSVEGLSDKVRDRLHFFMRQNINALSPSNFIWTNPEILKQTVDEEGANLLRGMKLFHDDLMNSAHYLKIRMMKDHAFEVGKDLAVTPGAVVFENEVFQLLQYEANTKEVFKTPLLIVPPFINKYYILDLREQNSFVNWLRSQGHTVFLMSWVNPTKAQQDIGFEDLAVSGICEAVKVVEDITGEKEMNAIGYCMGGTLLAATQGYYAGKRLKNRIKSATYMATILDFENPGELGVFINEGVINAIEVMDKQQGYFDGRQLAVTFSLLRENSLYWNYYIENYLKGKEPAEFDILYWNSDGTNVTPKVHSFLLRNLYLNNSLATPNQVRIHDVGISLSRVKTPSFFISTKEDHIALWGETFKGAQHLGGEKTLVLGESGHVAGIVNPPAKNKYGYYTQTNEFTNSQEWLEDAKFHEGSWWTYWQEWVREYAGEKIPAREIGNENHPAKEVAPGSYVKVSLVK